MKITRFILPLVCLTAITGCATEHAPITSEPEEIPNYNEQFDVISDVYSAFYSDSEEFNEDFGGWNYGSDGYLHVMVTCEDISSYEFLNTGEKRVVFEPAEYSFQYLSELAENFTLAVDGITLEGGSADIHKNKVNVYVDEETYSDSDTMTRLCEAAGDIPVDFVPPIKITV